MPPSTISVIIAQLQHGTILEAMLRGWWLTRVGCAWARATVGFSNSWEVTEDELTTYNTSQFAMHFPLFTDNTTASSLWRV